MRFILVFVAIVSVAITISAVSAQQTRSAAFNFFVRAATEAYDLGVWPDSLSETIGDYIVEDYIAPATNETEAEIVERIKQGPQRLSTAQLVREVKDGVVQVVVPDVGVGAGFIVDAEGRVVTNHHVVEDSRKVVVILSDGRGCNANVLDSHGMPDLAVVDILDCTGFKVLPLGNSSAVEVGEDVVAIGYPPVPGSLDDPREITPTVTRGIVSAKRLYKGIEHIQTDAAISQGNSGGPLLNYYGQVVGVNTFGTKKALADEINFAVASNEVKHRLPYLISGTTPAESNREWTRYTHPKHGYQVSIPPTWTLKDVEPDYNYWSAPRNAGGVTIQVFPVRSSYTLKDFVEWRTRTLAQMSKRWDTMYPVGTWGIPPTEDQPGKVIHAYLLQTAPEYCLSGEAELWVVAARSRSQNLAYLLTAGICQHSYHLYDDDRWDIMESFKVVGR